MILIMRPFITSIQAEADISVIRDTLKILIINIILVLLAYICSFIRIICFVSQIPGVLL